MIQGASTEVRSRMVVKLLGRGLLGVMMVLGVLVLDKDCWAQTSSLPASPKKPVVGVGVKSDSDAGSQLRDRVKVIGLGNGMTFLLVRRPGVPTFTAYLRVKAGGVDEQIGYTGLAHIFEHMAFKGTTVVGSRDWPKERELLHKLTRVGDALSHALLDSRGKQTPVVKTLQETLQQLQNQHKKLVKADEFTQIYQTQGGTGLNATTDKDLTSYFISLPSNRLPLWAHQEAARLAAPVFREYYRERAVVAEERRMAMSRGDGRLYESFIATAFLAHPYRFPTVGWMSDITTIPLSAVRQFFRQYYAPSNMVGAIVGDIDIQATRVVLEQTFGLIPRGSAPPQVRTQEPQQQGERRVEVEFHTNPQVMIGFHKPTAPHPHDDVFDVIEAILTRGPSSRLYRALVKKRLAQQVWASSLPGSRFPNVFTIAATPIAPTRTEDIESVIYQELEYLKKEPVTARELYKVRNQMELDFLRNLRSNQGLAAQLSYFQAVLGDWRYATYYNRRLSKVTPEAIMKVAQRYFRRTNRTVATLRQKKHTESKTRDASSPKRSRRTAQGSEPQKVQPTTRQARTSKTRRSQARADKTTASGKSPTTRPTVQTAAVSVLVGHPVQPSKTVQSYLDDVHDVSVEIRPLPSGLDRHPGLLPYKPLHFVPPQPTIVTLPNGITLYLLEDRELPLVDVYALIKTGKMYEPTNKIGLADIVGQVMRTGGFTNLPGDLLDEALDFRGIHLTSSISSEHGSASLSTHRRDLDWGLRALASMLRYPLFPVEKISLHKARMLEQYRRRNDNPLQLALRHFRQLIYGKHSRWARSATPVTIKAIQRKDLFDFHHHYYRPSHVRLAIVGDFNTQILLEQLRHYFGSWSGKPVSMPTLAPLPATIQPTVAVVRRPLPQSLILVGHLGPRRHHPQWLAGQVMNHILGGGGFGSRLMTEIRTQRGLAYFAGSQLMDGPDRGMFAGYTGTQPPTTGLALRTMLHVLQTMHKTGQVTPEELQQTRDTFLNQFIFLFQSPAQIVYRQAYYDYFGYPNNYLQTYRTRLSQITLQDVAQAARMFIDPKQFVILVVGWEPMFGDPALSTFGKVHRLSAE